MSTTSYPPAATVYMTTVNPADPAATSTAPITFFHNGDGNLRFVPPGQSTQTILSARVWKEAHGWYFWEPASAKLWWATAISQWNHEIPVAPTEQPSVVPLPTSTPAITSSTATEPKTVAPSATLTGAAATSSSNNGLSIGAIAGIAVGSFVGGALIAALLSWLLTKKKKPSKTLDSEASTVPLVAREKPTTAKTISIASSSPILYAGEGSVSQPLEDKAISGEISKISNLIKNHVQSYYHARSVSAGMIDYDDLHALGPGMPVSVGTLGSLLGNLATREIALRFCIAWVVTSRIQLHEASHRSLLPLEISECLQSMSPESWDSKVHTTLLAKWRVLTAELLHTAYVRNAFSVDDSRVHNIQGAAGVLENVLRPYIDTRMDNEQRSRNLEEILKRATQFAFTLFSQQNEWDFDWQDADQHSSDATAKSICVFPALVQVTDDRGEPLKPPRPFSEAVVRRFDG